MRKIKFIIRFILKIKLNPRIKTKGIVFLGKGVKIICEPGANITFGTNVYLKEGTILYAKKGGVIRVGDRVSTGLNTEISCGGSIDIGSDVIMGAYTYITDSNHGFSSKKIPIRNQPMEVGKTKIGSDVWLGRQSMVLKGANIGDRVVVAAGAIVTGVCSGDSIVGGIPAKEIKKI